MNNVGYLIKSKKWSTTRNPRKDVDMKKVEHNEALLNIQHGPTLESQASGIWKRAIRGLPISTTINEFRNLKNNMDKLFPLKDNDGNELQVPIHISRFKEKISQIIDVFDKGDGIEKLDLANKWAIPMYDPTYKIYELVGIKEYDEVGSVFEPSIMEGGNLIIGYLIYNDDPSSNKSQGAIKYVKNKEDLKKVKEGD